MAKKKEEIEFDWDQKIKIPKSTPGLAEWSNRKRASFLLKKLKTREKEMEYRKYKLNDANKTIIMIPKNLPPEVIEKKISAMREYLRISSGTKVTYFE